jgi:hypothetical protein
MSSRYNPGTHLGRKWENAMTLDKRSWGYRRNAKIEEFLTIKVRKQDTLLIAALVHRLEQAS